MWQKDGSGGGTVEKQDQTSSREGAKARRKGEKVKKAKA